jgi:hypothetical protein
MCGQPLALFACCRQQMDGCEQFRKHKLQLTTPSQAIHHTLVGSLVAPKQTKVSPHLSTFASAMLSYLPVMNRCQRFFEEPDNLRHDLFSQLPQRISIFAHNTFSNLNLLGKLGIVGS